MNKYFRISIIQEYISSKNFLFVLILLSQLLIYYFLKNLNWLGTPNLEVRDAYSFYVYDFSNIKNFLSQYHNISVECNKSITCPKKINYNNYKPLTR